MQIDKFAKRQGNDESFRFIIVVLITLISQLEHAFANLSISTDTKNGFFSIVVFSETKEFMTRYAKSILKHEYHFNFSHA